MPSAVVAEEGADDRVVDVRVEVEQDLAAGGLEAERDVVARLARGEHELRAPRVAELAPDAGDAARGTAGRARSTRCRSPPTRSRPCRRTRRCCAMMRMIDSSLNRSSRFISASGDEVDVLPDQLRAVGDQHPADDRVAVGGADERCDRDEQRRTATTAIIRLIQNTVEIFVVGRDRRAGSPRPTARGRSPDRGSERSTRTSVAMPYSSGGDPVVEDDEDREEVEDPDERARDADPRQPAVDVRRHSLVAAARRWLGHREWLGL